MKWEVLAMKSKRSFFNLGIIKQDFRQHGWIGIIFLLGLLLVLPLELLMIASDIKNEKRSMDTISHLDFFLNKDIQDILVISIPIVAAIFIFRYLQVKESADSIHSLPVLRGQLYLNHVISGLLMILFPIWFTAAVTWIICNLVGFKHTLTFSELLLWVGIVSLFTIFFFIFTVFIGMITGQSIAQGILTVIFLILPTGLLALFSYHLNIFLYGFSESFITSNQIEYWSPIIRYVEVRSQLYSSMEVLVYTLLILLFFFGSYLLYKYRHLETATDTIAFDSLKPVLKYGITFCAMLVGGAYFGSSQNDSTGWLYFGYVLAAIVGYFIAEMVLHKSWRIFKIKMVKGLVGYGVVMTMLILGLQFDVIGYETRVPNTDQIDSVFFGNGAYQLRDKMQNSKTTFHREESFIQNVRVLHEQIAKRQPQKQYANQHNGIEMDRSIFLAYKLKDGDMLVREYRIPTQSFESELKPIMESSSYKAVFYSFEKLEKKIEKITIRPAEYSVNREITITDPVEILELKEVLKQDILSLSYEEMNDTRINLAQLEVLIPYSDPMHYGGRGIHYESNAYEGAHYDIKKSYGHVKDWLEQKGYLSKVVILPEEIKQVEVARLDKQDEKWLSPDDVFTNRLTDAETVLIEDETEISEALENYGHFNGEGVQYYLRFTTLDGAQFYGVFNEENLPGFIPQLF
jgi:ABC-2 type transport system permease protein